MVTIPYPSSPTRQFERQPVAYSRDEGLPTHLDTFNHLVLAYQDAVFQQALWILGDEDAAEDATQETFLRAYRNMDRFNGGPFKPWILKIATNYCLDQLRWHKRHFTLPLDYQYPDGEEIQDPSWLVDPDLPVEKQVEISELRTKIHQHINRLPPKYRAAVILVDIQEMDYQEAASVLGIHMGTFKSRLCRARNQLQKWLQTDKKAYFS